MEKTTREPTRMDILVLLVTRRAWVLPILSIITGLGGATAREIRGELGVRAPIVKRGLWWLSKYGVVEKSGDKYVVSTDYRDAVERVLRDHCHVGNQYVYRIGATYIYVHVKKNRVHSYTAPEKYVAELIRLEDEGGGVFSALDYSMATGLPIKLARRVVRIRELLRICRGY